MRRSILGANAAVRGCAITALADQVEQAVLAEVLPLIEKAPSQPFPNCGRRWNGRGRHCARRPRCKMSFRSASDSNSCARRSKPGSRLTKAAVLFADGDIDKPGYELLRDKARVDLDAATEALSQLQVVEPSIELPPLETVLAAAEGWGAAMREGDIAAQREVLAALIERVVPVRVGRGQYDVEIAWTPLGEALRATVVSTNSVTTPAAA